MKHQNKQKCHLKGCAGNGYIGECLSWKKAFQPGKIYRDQVNLQLRNGKSPQKEIRGTEVLQQSLKL